MRISTEIDPFTGRLEEYVWDDAEQSLKIRTTADVTSIIEDNKRQANASIDQRFGNEMMHHVADIPMEVVEMWRREHNLDIYSNEPEQKKKLIALLNDPDHRFLKRTTARL